MLGTALAAAVCLSGCRTGARSGVKPQDLLPPAPTTPYVPPVSSLPPVVPPAPPPPAPSTAPRPAPPGASGGSYTEGGLPILVDNREVGRVSRADFDVFNRAWIWFVSDDPRWPAARDEWLRRGGAAPYVLSENLLRYFCSATKLRLRKAIDRVAGEAAAVGEVAVAYFASFLVLDTWPLQVPVIVRSAEGEERLVREWVNDDLTRRDAAVVLARIGEAAVPTLSSPPCADAKTKSVRHFALYALGKVGTDAAVLALSRGLLRPEWEDRGAAAVGLGFALRKNPNAKPWLEQAARDPDPFVRKKANEGLTGRLKNDL